MPIRPENKSRYPKDWKQISLQVRVAAGNRCEVCGAENGHPHPETGSKVVLTVAHLNHQPEDCSRENLQALCQRCHNSLDAEQRRLNRESNKYADREQGGQDTWLGKE